MHKKNVIAAFDFDGTLTLKDTLIDFIIFYSGRFRFFTGIIILMPVLILYKLKIIPNSRAKEILFAYFFKGKSIEEFNRKCEEYAFYIDRIRNGNTTHILREHLMANHTAIIISASISNWIKPWAYHNGISKVVSTEIEVKDGIITGKFSTPNCYGPEKVNRLLEEYPKREQYTLYAYGDSNGDKELLELADYPTLLEK
ncbi:MAG TPA: HAD-IB family hydrolase [Dysgonomonas sp.]|nr:HAD-IB family hydrolase [Dysgonomonas sp.]